MEVFRPRVGGLQLCLLVCVGQNPFENGLWCVPSASGLSLKSSNVDVALQRKRQRLEGSVQPRLSATTAPSWALQLVFDKHHLGIRLTPSPHVKLLSLPALSVALASTAATKGTWGQRPFSTLDELMAHADPPTADEPNDVPPEFAALARQVCICGVWPRAFGGRVPSN